MSILDIFVLGTVIAAAAGAALWILRRKKRSCGDCPACNAGRPCKPG